MQRCSPDRVPSSAKTCSLPHAYLRWQGAICCDSSRVSIPAGIRHPPAGVAGTVPLEQLLLPGSAHNGHWLAATVVVGCAAGCQ